MLDTIELTLYEDADRRSNPRFVRIVRAKVSTWWPATQKNSTIIEMDNRNQHHVTQDYATVTHLLTCDEHEDADHGADPLATAIDELGRARDGYQRYLGEVLDIRD